MLNFLRAKAESVTFFEINCFGSWNKGVASHSTFKGFFEWLYDVHQWIYSIEFSSIKSIKWNFLKSPHITFSMYTSMTNKLNPKYVRKFIHHITNHMAIWCSCQHSCLDGLLTNIHLFWVVSEITFGLKSFFLLCCCINWGENLMVTLRLIQYYVWSTLSLCANLCLYLPSNSLD